ncbi:MAG: hypothetical protein JWN32_2401 [Solirubrobacterales bacterium]|jgi:hypothetical protein|nr:hypothetical protein [Solirubrobacterales bacterium]
MRLRSHEKAKDGNAARDSVTERPLAPPTEPMLPPRHRRTQVESVFMRLVATAGVVGICVGLAAILGSQNVAGWIIGLVVSLTSVIIAGVLWSSREL